MRRWLVASVLLVCACGGSKSPADAAGSDTAAGSDLAVLWLPDGELCPAPTAARLPADPAACVPSNGTGGIYQLDGAFDAGTCGAASVACDGACGPRPTLDAQVEARVHHCLTGESTFVVTFSQGCATQLYLETPYFDPASTSACVARALGGIRFACAEQIPCWKWSESTIAP